ncbi:anti-sigma factor family protein [Luteipulveratus mongoliensis]|uniref:Putative zinc-finger domain-containing protein n=1 Tax=Luteipulveratus mongoliensis TaxID=571913 RepID=A0A0K1JLQ2_9MICO|nr:zf-HC2 domain-containing protein [Luteipulveratus mongoliensis]AKU17641.1 hypothetical protein VV02_20330 [Luteipulveratus mongoliensis]
MTVRARHLGEAVHDYVDGLLDADQTLWVERHLLVCSMCCWQVEQERALVQSLRAFRPDPSRQQDLVAGLLGLAEHTPMPPVAPRRTPTLVTWDAPPQYQSVRHPVLCALVAVAGCVGVALVVANVPTRVQSTASFTPSPANVRVAGTPRSVVPIGSNVVPAAIARAERDAEDSIDAPDAQPLVLRASLRVP